MGLFMLLPVSAGAAAGACVCGADVGTAGAAAIAIGGIAGITGGAGGGILLTKLKLELVVLYIHIGQTAVLHNTDKFLYGIGKRISFKLHIVSTFLLVLYGSKCYTSVMTAEAERIAECACNLHISRAVSRIVKIAFGICHLKT